MTTKRCPDCGEYRPLASFTRNKRSPDGLAFYCAVCARARHVASRRRRFGPPKTRNGQGPKNIPPGQKWCPACDLVMSTDVFSKNLSQSNGMDPYCKPCFNAIKKRDKEKNHGSTRNYHLKRRYNITEADFDVMFIEQNGVCAICREAAAVHTDHDHKTGRVRGLLCFNCNQGLGNFRDRGDIMLLAMHYLERGAEATYRRPPGVNVTFAMGFDGEDPRPPDEEQDIPPSMVA